jgi:hypothetical protein
MPARQAVKLFVSYSHKDHVWMKRLMTVLEGFQYDDRLAKRSLRFVHAWHDKELTKGNHWDGEIQQELSAMDIFVPLVSMDYFSSWYIQNVELPCARERHALGEILVVPILIYPVNLQEKCAFLHAFSQLPSADRLWSKFRDHREALEAIDNGLWSAIDEALKRRARKRV